MMKILYTTCFILYWTSIMGQFSVQLKAGFLQELQTYTSEVDSDLFVTGWEKFANGNGFDGDTYRNIGLSYAITNKYAVELRYQFEHKFIKHCFNINRNNFGTGCFSSSVDDYLKLSTFFHYNLLTYKKLALVFSSGIGLMFYTRDRFNSRGAGGAGNGTGPMGFYYFFTEKDEVNQGIVLSVPLETKLSYQFNKYFSLNLNMGYNYGINGPWGKSHLTYTINNSEERFQTVEMKDHFYIGLGVSIHFDLSKKSKEDEIISP